MDQLCCELEYILNFVDAMITEKSQATQLLPQKVALYWITQISYTVLLELSRLGGKGQWDSQVVRY